jgi:hypothetical protein
MTSFDANGTVVLVHGTWAEIEKLSSLQARP